MKINRAQCRRCRYGFAFTGSPLYPACDYLGITGHMRGCDTYPKCERFEPKAGKRKKGDGRDECS